MRISHVALWTRDLEGLRAFYERWFGARAGYAHIAISVGSRAAVDALASRMRGGGVRVQSGPRVTGDGYYESVVEDPDGNLIEITI